MTWAEFKYVCNMAGIMESDEIERIEYAVEPYCDNTPKVEIEKAVQDMYHPRVTLTRKVQIK